MTGVLLVIGWMLLGGALGYITERWKIVYVLMLALFGLALIVRPELPGLLGTADDGRGSWPETVGFVVGMLIGTGFARRERVA